MSDDENRGGPRDTHGGELEISGIRSISEIFGSYNVLGSDVQVILDGRPVTSPSTGS